MEQPGDASTPPDRQGLAFDFGFAHHFQFFRDVAALFGQLGIFDDVIINAIFVIALHAGDDAWMASTLMPGLM